MDLLEYQGKQLFARHGVPVPSGAPATTVEEAVAAADEIGYPCVIKVQVQIGRMSVNAVEITSGLNVGDQVVLSDMSTWDAFDRVRLE